MVLYIFSSISLPVSSDPYRTIYEIARASKSDEGTYSCTARNEAGEEEGRIQLIVDDGSGGGGYRPTPPTEDEKLYYYRAGTRAELRCGQSKSNYRESNSSWFRFITINIERYFQISEVEYLSSSIWIGSEVTADACQVITIQLTELSTLSQSDRRMLDVTGV